MTDSTLHQTHPDIVNRLKRAEGHLKKIIEMLAQQRPCLDIAQQLHAIEKSISAAKKVLIHDHIDHCLERTVGPTTRQERVQIDEFKEITKYL